MGLSAGKAGLRPPSERFDLGKCLEDAGALIPMR
jgi:hypothetical protein